MHEIESLVELSVYSLHESKDEELDRRSLFYNLYQLQQQFDTGFTHFRVMDILIQHRFVYTFPVTAHPAYAQHAAYFDALAAGGKFSFIYTDPEKEWDAATNPVAGYANYDHPSASYILYCDAGSPLWEALVAKGTLTGNDAVAPEVTDVFTLAYEVAETAAEQENKDLLNSWYQLLPYMVMQAEQEGTTINYKALESILELVVSKDAISGEGLPPADELPVGGELGKFCAWWYEPAKDKMKTTADEPAEEIDLDSIPFTQEVEKTATWYDAQVRRYLEEINQAIASMEDNGHDDAIQEAVGNKLAQGLEYAAKAVELAPNDPGILVNKGSLHLLQENYPAALASYDAALTLAPDNTFIHLNRAILFYHMENIPAAIASFERVLELEPGNEFAKQWISVLK